MACIKPLEIKYINENGDEDVVLAPCRKCILCRKRRAQDWAIKLIKESLYYKKMCMITLTFGPKFLLRPLWVKLTKYKTVTMKNEEGIEYKKQIKYKESTLISPKYITDVRLTKWLISRFIKKLRKKLSKNGIFISYFAAGEHGTQKTHRAHWHIIFFGIDKETLNSVCVGKSKKNKEIYMSPLITELWSFKKLGIGKHTISDVNTKTIKYTANYTLKKMYKEEEKLSNDNIYTNMDDSNNPKYHTAFICSSQNKLGYKWIRRYPEAVLNLYINDEDGAKYAIPKGYINELKRYELDDIAGDDCQINRIIAEEYESLILEKIQQTDRKEYKENQKRKAERLKYRIQKEQRDTEF